MKGFCHIAVLTLALIHCVSLEAQNSEEIAVKKVIDDLFEGMRAGDSTLVSSLFHAKVRMLTSHQTESGDPVLKEGSLNGFLNAIGTPHPNVWNEKIWNTEIRIDDDLAQVWTDYAFYVDEDFSHCGVDAFQLVKETDGQWRIIHLIDTRRKEPCENP